MGSGLMVGGGRVCVGDKAGCGRVAGRLLTRYNLTSMVSSGGVRVNVGPGLMSPSRTS